MALGSWANELMASASLSRTQKFKDRVFHRELLSVFEVEESERGKESKSEESSLEWDWLRKQVAIK